MPKIAILDDYQNAVKSLRCFSLLDDFSVVVYATSVQSEAELIERLEDQDGIVLIRERTHILHSLLAGLPHLKIISQTGKIGNHIDLQACSNCGVAVAEGVGSPVATAELCWALIMTASRHIVSYATNLQRGHWQDSGGLGLGRSLSGLTMGIWGYGRIGKQIARFADVFGMKVLVWGSDVSRKQAVLNGFKAAKSKADLFSSADILSLNLRLTPETKSCISYKDLQLMKKDSLLVNTSRAALIVPHALYDSLLVGRPGYAALDVYAREPVFSGSDPLLQLPNVLCTPHLGYVEKNSYELYFRVAFQNIVNFFHGKPQNVANPEALSV